MITESRKIQRTKENNACLWRVYQSSYRKLEESESLCLLETVEISKISKSEKETYSGLYFYLFRSGHAKVDKPRENESKTRRGR